MEFDFEKWARLAQEDPAEFERQREAAIRTTIAAAPPTHRQRLEGLQFRIDMERQRSGSALGACVRLNSLMWAGFYRLRKELNAAAEELAEPQSARGGAQVIPFEPARQRRAGSRSGGDKGG